MAMLSFDLRSLGAKPVTVNARLLPDDPIWRSGDPVPAGPVDVAGRLSSAGSGRFYWHGRFEGRAVLPCRRCLEETQVAVSDDLYLIFVESGDPEADNPDVYTLAEESGELDLRPALREHWLLDVPRFALCREDCKGLCPDCGAELNRGPCACPPAGDRRWDALRAAAGRVGSGLDSISHD